MTASDKPIRLKRRADTQTIEVGQVCLEVRPAGAFEKDMAEELARGYARKVVESSELAATLNLSAGVLARLGDLHDGLDFSAGFGLFLYAVALGEISIVQVLSGVESPDGCPAPFAPSLGDIALLFQENLPPPSAETYAGAFITRISGLRILEDGEGKGCAAVPGISGGAAANPAGDVRT